MSGASAVDQRINRILVTRYRSAEGLELALPAGKIAVFGQREGHRILLGEGQIDDYAVGEKVEIAVATATGVRARQVVEELTGGSRYRLSLSNDLSAPQRVEIELPLGARAKGVQLVKRDGWMLWQVIVPANGRAEIVYAI